MNAFVQKFSRILALTLLLPTLLLADEEEALPTTPETEETPALAQSTEESTKKAQETSVNAAGISFIVIAIGGIILTAFQNSGSEASSTAHAAH